MTRLMNQGARHFELQFQWEDDRLVFRHRQRGLPVEVTEAERDRLVERYKARSKMGMRILLTTLIGVSLVIGFLSPLVPTADYLGFGLFGGVFLSILLLHRWAFDGTTAHLRDRRPIGEPLGAAGGFIRSVGGMPTRHLVFGMAYFALCVVLIPAMSPGKRPDPLTLLVLAIAGGSLLLSLIVKWALYERRRLRGRAAGSLDRARSLRID